jgi:hypothetical protein
MRLGSIAAIAHRDLQIEFGARRGWLLPVVAAFILLPMSTAPPVPEKPLQHTEARVSGDVPPEIADLERIVVDPDNALVRFIAPSAANEHTYLIRSDYIPAEVREKMDELHPGVRTEVVDPRAPTLPNRSLFLALVAASILTGSISQSIPGERTSRTLETLLTAGVARSDIVLGKWLAWGGFGGSAACFAGLVAVALGRQELGWWLLPMPWVSLGTVALGFYLVRRANDVIGGATVAIRVLPAVLTVSGLVAWGLGGYHPLLGAMVPIGGALVASGDTWPGLLPPILSTATTAALCAGALTATARDIANPERAADDRGTTAALQAAALAALAWWSAMLGPIIWAAGGNPDLEAGLARHSGPLAGALGIGLLLFVKAGRALQPARDLGVRLPPTTTWRWSVAVGVLLALTQSVPSGTALPTTGLWALAAERLGDAMQPTWSGPGILGLTIIAQELLFRGWLRRHTSDLTQVLCFALIFAPLDPLWGLWVGAVMTQLARIGGDSALPCILARFIWAILAGAISLPAAVALPILLAGSAVLARLSPEEAAA